MKDNKNEMIADYVIVGAGSAGCVLASRLSEDPNCLVILIEAGGSDKNLIVQMPSAFYLPMQSKTLNWGYASEPEPNMNGRRLDCPRGRVLGGSSSINGMVYVRGNANDYERWEKLGAKGWGYSEVLPYFKKAQHADKRTSMDEFQGHDGPLGTTSGELKNPLYNYFLAAAKEAGHSMNADFNGRHQEGFGVMPMTVADGIRSSTARSYLPKDRSNLTVIKKTMVCKILIKGGKAEGVSVADGFKTKEVFANKEVLVCAGAINSPQLLMLSGIGPKDHLKNIGVKLVADVPGVGENLMDHLEVYVQQSITQPLSLYKDLSLFGRAKIGLEWLLTQRGLGATNHFEVGGYMRSHADAEQPDIQFHFLPAAMSYDGTSQASGHGCQAHVGPMLSPSRGTVRLRSNNALEHPTIKFNYMSHPSDWEVFRAAIRGAREIFAQPAFDAIRGPEFNPGVQAQTDKELDAFVRAHAESAYHPCGTCKMGVDDMSVVDYAGRVQQIDNLRVIDASIFPHITNGNLNAPTIMVAEKMADMIKAA
ncbi:MAG: choline dehydrogenase [Candidatus Azotimanducaceae bacterium]|jgi:choline dehydrogenase|tara:strand:+ start:6400 stop:8004 length:1605 start_codon:yes stop_codon:yes gene_type:complete